MSKGKLFIVSGASGVGKSTVLKSLLENRKDVYFSVSATTRTPREGEVDGDVALLVLQTGGAHFLGFAHEVLEHAAGVPFAQRGTVHDVESFESEQ